MLTKVAPTSALRTQITMDIHPNCWVIAMNSQANGYIKPITSKLCFEEIVCCQEDKEEVPIQLTFHRRIKPIATDLQELCAMSNQMDSNTPIVCHIVALPDQPVAEKLIFQCLKGPHSKHWKEDLFAQYHKNSQMLLLSSPYARELLPPEMKVYPSIIASLIK